MTLYLIIAALVVCLSTALTFSSKVGTNKHLLVHLILFPIVYVACGMPLEQIGIHFLFVLLAFVAGFLAFVIWKIGGGVARAFVIAALWIPGPALFFNYFVATLIGGGLLAVIACVFGKSDRVDHFATLVFACCSGFLIHQYDLQTKQPQKIVTAQTQIEYNIPRLRGAQ
jgi:Flp pilus assembly protein protease CpaA